MLTTPPDGSPTLDDHAEAPPADLPQTAALVVWVGAKGGCGTTMLAANVAAAMAADHRVCLLDLDLCKGDVGGALDMPGVRTVDLLLERIDALDDALVRGAVEVHASGLHVLSQPYDLTELHDATADEVGRLLGVIRSGYEVLFVDAGSRVDAASLTACMSADEVVLVSTTEVSALRDAQRLLRLLHRLEVPLERVRLVLNKVEAGHGVPVEEVGVQLPVAVAATVSRSDHAADKADKAGRLVSEVAPLSALARDLGSLWGRLHDAPQLERTWRSRWFAKK